MSRDIWRKKLPINHKVGENKDGRKFSIRVKKRECSKDIFPEYIRDTFPNNIAANERVTVSSAFSTMH